MASSYPRCAGAGRARGIMPGAGRRSAEEWAEWEQGRLRCVHCHQYVPHDAKGRLLDHDQLAESSVRSIR